MVFGLGDMIELRKKEGLNPIIAEIKIYSPKHGDLLRGRDPLEILKVYERCKVAGISYITSHIFKGNLKMLEEICNESNLPVLRKDFILSKEEIELSASIGASAILLIARILGEKTAEFVDYALEHGLEALVEVHTIGDVKIVESTKASIVGINNRDISKLEIDNGNVDLTRRLSPLIQNKIKVSESGIMSLDDLRIALRYADAALIGTAFMKAEDTEAVVKSFVEAKLC